MMDKHEKENQLGTCEEIFVHPVWQRSNDPVGKDIVWLGN